MCAFRGTPEDTVDNIFDSRAIERLGRTLVSVAGRAPEWLVTGTPFMPSLFRTLGKMADVPGKARARADLHREVARRLGFHESQFDHPGIAWGRRGGYRYPMVLATWQQQVEYFDERRPHQVVPQMVAQIDHVFRKRELPPVALPTRRILDWLRGVLLHTPAHWYTTRVPADEHGGAGLELDFSATCDAVDYESSDCKYNVRDIRLTDDGKLIVNARSRLRSVPRFTASESDPDPRPLRHAAFLAMTLIQQLNEVVYHNWVHFYFNDLVLFNVQNHFPRGHWVRTLLDPHMKYQNVLNNAGLFSHLPSDSLPNELYDDILFGGVLLSWTTETFHEAVIDRTLGYYQHADLSAASAESRRLGFQLDSLVPPIPGAMGGSIQELDGLVRGFVADVVARAATDEDLPLMGLLVDNVLKFLHPGALGESAKPDDVRDAFIRIVSRYLLQAGILHGIEHMTIYFWHAPLQLPQRIRRMYDTRLSLDDYAYPIDRQNGSFGHGLFTRYVPAPDDAGSWKTLDYHFADAELQRRSAAFVRDVQRAMLSFDERVLAPARAILDDHSIPWTSDSLLRPEHIATSICI